MWMWEAIDIEYLGWYGYELRPELQKKDIEGMSLSETAVYFKERFLSRRVWKKLRVPGWIW